MSNALAAVPFNEIERMAQAMAQSGFFGFKTTEQALAVMLIAHANGQHPATAAQDYDVIQNKPAKKPQAMLRDFLANGGKVDWHESSDAAAEATFSHPAGGSIRVRWDMERANKMGLGSKDNYKKQAGVMFRWRCVSEGVRIIFPAATGGMYTPDEVRDIPQEPEKNITPRQEQLPPPSESEQSGEWTGEALVGIGKNKDKQWRELTAQSLSGYAEKCENERVKNAAISEQQRRKGGKAAPADAGNQSTEMANEADIRLIRKCADEAQLRITEVLEMFELESTDQIRQIDVAHVLAFISNPGKQPAKLAAY